MAKISSHQNFDYILFWVCAILVVLGIIALTSVSVDSSLEIFGIPYYFISHQLIYGLAPGILLAFLLSRLKIEKLYKWAIIFLLISILFLGLVFVPQLGISVGGATRWLKFGPVSFQPSELFKISFFIYLAALLSKDTFSNRLFIFLLIIGAAGIFLVLQPNVGTLGIIFLVASVTYFLSNAPVLHTLLIFLLGFSSVAVLTKIAPYRFNRFLVFLNPEVDPIGIGYQIKQALIAVGSGGITGLGFGMSVQKLGFLPEPMTDAIFAVFAEETGFIGSLILIILFSLFLWRGFYIARMVQDKFQKLLCLSITFWIVLQAFINIGAMIGILPLTGIPLPFMSYGGSAIIAELAGVGILLNISRNI
ncbi:MAG: putative lipid II flippase FtsW [Candidatus Nealsonbacteria bacterium]|nr:putative lipid II flippase FtsW [Candidatus Nealsonbacteria bacterium]